MTQIAPARYNGGTIEEEGGGRVKKLYYYGMRLRGAAPGCQPRNGLEEILDGDERYYNILAYDRKLAEEELDEYELDEIDNH